MPVATVVDCPRLAIGLAMSIETRLELPGVLKQGRRTKGREPSRARRGEVCLLGVVSSKGFAEARYFFRRRAGATVSCTLGRSEHKDLVVPSVLLFLLARPESRGPGGVWCISRNPSTCYPPPSPDYKVGSVQQGRCW